MQKRFIYIVGSRFSVSNNLDDCLRSTSCNCECYFYNQLHCMSTEQEVQRLEEAKPGPEKAKVLKNVARRLESQLETYYQQRNCKERLRFDPKLKEKGLLDLKNV